MGDARCSSAAWGGFTLVETLVALGTLGVLLLAAAGGTRYVRDELKRRETAALLARLDEAVAAYQQATGSWPAAEQLGRRGDGAWGRRGAEAAESSQGSEFRVQDQQRVAAEVLTALRAVPAARQVLERLAREMPGALAEDGLRDGWGATVRCLTVESGTRYDQQAVAANGGRPVFISDGADGDGPDEMRTAYQ